MRIPGFQTSAAAPSTIADLAPDVIADYLANWSPAPSAQQHALNVRHALDSWPAELHALSVRSAGFEITAAERYALHAAWGEFHFPARYATAASVWNNAVSAFGELRDSSGYRLCDITVIADLVRKITATIEQLPYERPFFKLGTRAPKNSPFFALSGGRIENGEQALLLMLTSNRIVEDLISSETWETARAAKDAVLAGRPLPPQPAPFKIAPEAARAIDNAAIAYLPWLWFREAMEIPPYAEFRCFMRDKQFVGATQYHNIVRSPDPKLGIISAAPFSELCAIDRATGEMAGYTYERIIKAWFPSFAAAAPYQGCVFDVFVDLETERVVLLETNPAATTTFPGLKDWSEPTSFNGELDWVSEPYRNPTIRLSTRDVQGLKQQIDQRRLGLLADVSSPSPSSILE